MSYFHTGTRTIIGAKSFHCPVRDGKEWYQLAMVIRHNCLTGCSEEQPIEFIEQISFYLVIAHHKLLAMRLLNASTWHNILDRSLTKVNFSQKLSKL